MIAAGIVLLVLAAFGAGALLFSYLTRRLRRLTGDVTEFTAGRFDDASPVAGVADPRERIAGSIAVSVIHWLAGVRLFRVHDVAAHREALDVAVKSGEWSVVSGQ